VLTLVTVIYGDARRYRVELFGSVLSLLRHRRNPETRIVVYTDRSLEGFPLPVSERIITPEEWNDWTGDSGITHLVKLHLARQTLEESGGPLIYFDTDTLFMSPPEQLAARLTPDTALMHAAEGPLSAHDVCAKIVDWLGAGREVCGVWLSPDTLMHNSGIVGVVTEHRDALLRAADIADALCEIDPIFSLDQLSTGASLSGIARVETCEHDVLHYWGWNRAFVRDAIDTYWRNNEGASLNDLCDGFDPEFYATQPAISIVDKLRARWVGWRRGLSADARFACLALLAARRAAAQDVATANNWAAVHLDFLDRMSTDSHEPARLRRLLAHEYAACRSWLNSENSMRLDARLESA